MLRLKHVFCSNELGLIELIGLLVNPRSMGLERSWVSVYIRCTCVKELIT